MRFELGNIKNISFWEDNWGDHSHLIYSFKDVHETAMKQRVTVEEVYRRGRYRLNTQERVDRASRVRREELITRIQAIELVVDKNDMPILAWNSTG